MSNKWFTYSFLGYQVFMWFFIWFNKPTNKPFLKKELTNLNVEIEMPKVHFNFKLTFNLQYKFS